LSQLIPIDKPHADNNLTAKHSL